MSAPSGNRAARRKEARMSTAPLPRRALLASLPALLLGAEASAQTAPAAGQPVARILIDQTQAAFIGSVAWGSGTLIYRGRNHPLRIRGLGIGGVGFARVRASGEVYDMRQLSDFPGVFGQARAGVVAGNAQLRGGIWLANPAGVRINLRPNRQGLALQLGADGMVIELR
jgi:hypothetical protein